MTLEDLQKFAYLTTLPDVTPDQVNDTTGLYRYWLEHKAELGTPVTAELTLDDGTVAQRFATGKIVHYDGGVIRVL